jgi:hypothetical protein
MRVAQVRADADSASQRPPRNSGENMALNMTINSIDAAEWKRTA